MVVWCVLQTKKACKQIFWPPSEHFSMFWPPREHFFMYVIVPSGNFCMLCLPGEHLTCAFQQLCFTFVLLVSTMRTRHFVKRKKKKVILTWCQTPPADLWTEKPQPEEWTQTLLCSHTNLTFSFAYESILNLHFPAWPAGAVPLVGNKSHIF